jgi:rhodanese-related sulfurtransferase
MDQILRRNSGAALVLPDDRTILRQFAQDSKHEVKIMVEVVTRDELKKGLADGSITLFDVREPHEFAAGHIPGATSLPLSRFDPTRLPRDGGKRIVFSCRSGHRTLQAIEMARLGGRMDACAHYAGSMIDWVGAGENVEV